jgi:uncharacterized damage-inducible protein DinB
MGMPMQDDLKSLFAYNRWANGRVVEACRALGPGQYEQEIAPGWPSIRSTLVHVADATWIWARRIAGEPVAARAAEADVPTLDDAEVLLARGHDAFDHLLATLPLERLAAVWSYRSFDNQEMALPLWAVFRHVVNHATYHRGQIASKFGRLGGNPAKTDLVLWAIEQTRGSSPRE